jgi:hypothetical protein
MEAEINSFTRKSKKYRTKYMDEIQKLYGDVTRDSPLAQETISEDDLALMGISIKSNIT